MCCASKKEAEEEVKKSVEDNVQKGQEKQVAAYANKYDGARMVSSHNFVTTMPVTLQK